MIGSALLALGVYTRGTETWARKRLGGTGLPTRAVIMPLASDSKSKDGLNVHAACLDEIHEHRDGSMWDVLETGMGARSQPLLNAITTAGFNAGSFGARKHREFAELIDPETDLTDDHTFIYIAALDAANESEALKLVFEGGEQEWLKANPSLGAIPPLGRDLARMVEQVRRRREGIKNLLVKRFNFWVGAAEGWLDLAAWNACPESDGDPLAWRTRMLEELAGEVCFAGLDLAATKDLTALVLWFPDVNPPVVLPWFWIPDEALHLRMEEDRVPYDAWIRDGFLETTPGEMTDYDHILAALLGSEDEDGERSPGLLEHFQVERLAIDPKEATSLMTKLDKAGFDRAVVCNQSVSNMNEPSKTLESMVIRRSFRHGGNPVLRWNAGNATVKRYLNGHIRPIKESKTSRIDGIVAFVFAIWRAAIEGVERGSVYEERGVIMI